MPDSRSRHLVDPDLLEMVGRPAADRSRPFAQQRAESDAQYPEPPKLRPGVRLSERFVPGPDGQVRVLVYEPDADVRSCPAVLQIHGGGFIIGRPEMSDERNAMLVQKLRCVIVSVDYRLAPEAPYPAAVEDCHAALVWLHKQAAALRVDTKRIGIMGESAGGGHAAALALMARDRGAVPLAFQWLTYPMLDDRTGSTATPHPYAGEFLWPAEANRIGWRALLGREPGGPPPGPYAVPARAEDLSRLPPALIQTGSLDLFVEEDIEYARRLMHAGVAVELHVYPGCIHGFVRTKTPVAKKAESDGVAALERALGKGE